MNKNQFKQLALTAAVAIVCSGATVFSIGRLSAATGLPGASLFTMNSNSEGTPAEQAAGQNKFYRTAAVAAPANTDFTKAAESTVNGVVSIKSFATRLFLRNTAPPAASASAPSARGRQRR